jgi:16S rRNA C967 or C1407 C5-methylase (RsmB/RsmF family)
MARLTRTKNIEKVACAIFDSGQEREAFLCAVEQGARGVTAVAWLIPKPAQPGYLSREQVPSWLPPWIDVAAEDERPGTLPEHESGAVYLLDLSSTFAVAPLAHVECKGGLLVDVCAAPGGKGIVGLRYCEPDVLLGNEVIRKRTAQLIANYKRCAIDPAVVTSVDPKLLARLLGSRANVVIVDAPCSGQSLVLKDRVAPGAFHPATISMNERRQRRILAESSKVVQPGGYLLYSTCTFSPEENERNVAWFCKTFPDFVATEVPTLEAYRSQLSDHASYRLFPQQGFGAGGFCCLLRRAGELTSADSESWGDICDSIRPVWTSQSVRHDKPKPAMNRSRLR